MKAGDFGDILFVSYGLFIKQAEFQPRIIDLPYSTHHSLLYPRIAEQEVKVWQLYIIWRNCFDSARV